MELNALNPTMETGSDRKYTGLTDIVERHYLPRIMGNDKARTEHLKRMEDGYSSVASLYATLINNDGKVTNIGDHNRKFNINGEEKRIDMHSLAGKGKALEEAIGKENYFTLDDLAKVESTWTNKIEGKYYKSHENAVYFDRVAEKITAKKIELENAKKESKPVILESSYSDGKKTQEAENVHTFGSMQDSGETHVYTAEELAKIPNAKGGRLSGLIGRVAASGLFALYTLGFVGAAAVKSDNHTSNPDGKYGATRSYDDNGSRMKIVFQDGDSGIGPEPNDGRLAQIAPDMDIIATRLNAEKAMSLTEMVSHGARSLEDNVAKAYTALSDYISNVKSEMTFGSYVKYKLNSIGRKAKGMFNAIMNYEDGMQKLEESIFENGENGVTRLQFESWLNSPNHPFFNTAKEIKEKYGDSVDGIKKMIETDFNGEPLMRWLYNELRAYDTGKYDAWAATDGVQKRLEEALGRTLSHNQRLKLLFMAASVISAENDNGGTVQNVK